ncbi:hypothetical protein [uncultured Dokdonia sp.]|uniref:hypothetical protein n=1 Tax=uncultured Dokdonia sp. TaxID=575653 RepID=UPI002624B03A|nr:hypothetical protein [uncultured Dokdonia sp.]
MKKVFFFLTIMVIQSPLFAQLNNNDIISLRADTGKWMARCYNCQKATTSNTITAHISNDAKTLPTYAKFTVKKMPNGKIALKTDNGKYLGRCRNCVTGAPSDILTAHVGSPNPSYAQFEPILLANGKYVFKSDNGKYLARCRNCSPGSSVPDIVAIHENNPNAAYAQWTVTIKRTPQFSSIINNVQSNIQIKNLWKKDGKTDYKIHIENSKVDAGGVQPNWLSSRWHIEEVPGTKYIRIRNHWKKDGRNNFYLQTANGILKAGPLKSRQHSSSSQWLLEKVSGTTYRIKNRATSNQYLHIENATLELGPIQPNWRSALWELQGYKSSSR